MLARGPAPDQRARRPRAARGLHRRASRRSTRSLVRRAARELPATELGGWRARDRAARRPARWAWSSAGLVFGPRSSRRSPRARRRPSLRAVTRRDRRRCRSRRSRSAPGRSDAHRRALRERERRRRARVAARHLGLSTSGSAASSSPTLYPDAVRAIAPLSVLVAARHARRCSRVLDLPAVLELEPRAGERRYVALLGLDDAGGARSAGREQIEFGRAELERAWTGRAFYLWTNFESLPVLEPGMKGGAVRWLQARLAELGYLQRGRSDRGVRRAHRRGGARVPARERLEPSGEVGPETLIALYQALDYTTPRLFAVERRAREHDPRRAAQAAARARRAEPVARPARLGHRTRSRAAAARADAARGGAASRSCWRCSRSAAAGYLLYRSGQVEALLARFSSDGGVASETDIAADDSPDRRGLRARRARDARDGGGRRGRTGSAARRGAARRGIGCAGAGPPRPPRAARRAPAAERRRAVAGDRRGEPRDPRGARAARRRARERARGAGGAATRRARSGEPADRPTPPPSEPALDAAPPRRRGSAAVAAETRRREAQAADGARPRSRSPPRARRRQAAAAAEGQARAEARSARRARRAARRARAAPSRTAFPDVRVESIRWHPRRRSGASRACASSSRTRPTRAKATSSAGVLVYRIDPGAVELRVGCDAAHRLAGALSARVGAELELAIERLAAGGDGVAHVDGLDGVRAARRARRSRARARHRSVEPRFARAEIEALLAPGPARREPPCPYYGRCGGCSWLHLDEAEQLARAGRDRARGARAHRAPRRALPEIEYVAVAARARLPLARARRVRSAAASDSARAPRTRWSTSSAAPCSTPRPRRSSSACGRAPPRGRGRARDPRRRRARRARGATRFGSATARSSRRIGSLWERWQAAVARGSAGSGERAGRALLRGRLLHRRRCARASRAWSRWSARPRRATRARNTRAEVVEAAARGLGAARARARSRPELVLLNPPRTGCHQ